MPVYFMSELFTSYIPYLSSETYSCKYKKLPNIVIHACTNMTEKMNLLKMSGPQTYLFTFRPIASKQLNSLLKIDTLSWLGGTVVQEVPGSFPGSGNGFYVWFSVLLLLCFYFLSINTLFVTTFWKSFCNVNLLTLFILNILHLWLIIRA